MPRLLSTCTKLPRLSRVRVLVTPRGLVSPVRRPLASYALRSTAPVVLVTTVRRPTASYWKRAVALMALLVEITLPRAVVALLLDYVAQRVGDAEQVAPRIVGVARRVRPSGSVWVSSRLLAS